MAKLIDKQALNEAPKEVLTEIFNELNQDNIKSACLMCKTWYQVDNKVWFLYSNKYFIYKSSKKKISNYKSIEDLKKIKRVFFNLKFECIDFRTKFGQKYWEKHSKNIRGLEFIDCIITSNLICNILNNCSNLVTFSIKDTGQRYIPLIRFTEIPLLPICTRVLSFSLVIDSFQRFHYVLPKGFLYTICRSFPFMENLYFSVNSFMDNKTAKLPSCLSTLDVSSEAAYTLADRILNDLNRFKSIEINVGDRTFNNLICQRLYHTPLPTLKNLRVCLMWEPNLCLDYNFFWQLSKLEHINFTAIFSKGSEGKGDVVYLAQIMECLLEFCPNLKTMTMTHCAEYAASEVNLNEFATTMLMRSKLETLNCFNFNLKIASTKLLNYSLKYLCVKRPQSTWRDISQPRLLPMLCQPFYNLISLEIPSIDDFDLQAIFKCQTQLKILILMNCDKCSDYGFTGYDQSNEMGKSIQVMEKLKYLKLRMEFTPQITERMVEDFKITNLTHLSVRIYSVWHFWKEFVASLYNCPMIEDIHCYFEEEILDDYEIWADMIIHCRYLTNLDILYKDGVEFNYNSCEYIIECRPSLQMFRCLLTNRVTDGQYFFKYNPEYNALRPLDWDRTYEEYPMPI